jgi:pimeloyl-ACP methyl ester carboxylesterase
MTMIERLLDSDAFNQRVFFPRRDHHDPPSGAVDRLVQVHDASIHVRIHDADSELPILLLFHGNGEVAADYDGQATTYRAVGVRLAVADFRGYGVSTGTPTLRALLPDALAVFEDVHDTYGGPLFVMGRSLGSMSALQIAGHVERTKLFGIVIESGFVDLAGFIARRGLPTIVTKIAESVLDVYDGRRKLARTTAPVLVLHGDSDTMIVPGEAEMTFAAIRSPSRHLVWVAGRGHNDLMYAPEYWQALRDFVARTCAATAKSATLTPHG